MADWADGSDLAGMSRGGNLLQQMGYDPDEVRMNPGMRAELMQKLASPMQMAQNTPPPPLPTPNPRSQNGNNIAPAPGMPRLFNREQPSAAAQPVPTTLPAATSPSVSPSGTSQPTQQSMAGVDVTNARSAVGNLLAPEPAVPDTSAQDAMIAAKSVPLNPRNPLYKEGTMGRIGRGLEAAAVGFGKGGVPAAVEGAADPAMVGVKPYGAPNSGYDIDDQTRQAQLGLAQKQKADAMAKFKEMADLRKQQDTASKDAGTISVDTAGIPIKQQTADADTVKANADQTRATNEGYPKNEMEAISAYGRETDPTKKAALWDTVQKMHKAAISERPPRESQPSAELVRYEDLKAAAVRENQGKPLNPGQLAKLSMDLGMNQKPEGSIPVAQADRIKARKDTAMATAQKYLNDRTDGKGRYTKDNFIADMNRAQHAYEASITDAGGSVNHMEMQPDMSWKQDAAAPANSATPQASAPKLTNGAWEGMEKPRSGEVAVIAPDGTVGYATSKWLQSPAGKGFKKAQ